MKNEIKSRPFFAKFAHNIKQSLQTIRVQSMTRWIIFEFILQMLSNSVITLLCLLMLGFHSTPQTISRPCEMFLFNFQLRAQTSMIDFQSSISNANKVQNDVKCQAMMI